MDKAPISFPAAIRKWAEERRRGLADALPDPESLVAYREGELGPGAEAAMQERLVLHPSAARELLDLASFEQLQPPAEQFRLSDEDVEKALAAMRARIRSENEQRDAAHVPTTAVHTFSSRRSRRLRSIAWASTVAALLAIAVGASWIEALYRKLDERAAPRYAKVIDVATTRGARPHAVSPDAEWIQLVVHDIDLGYFARGRLQISTADGEVLYQHDFMPTRDRGSLLTLDLPRDLLSSTTYRIEVFGLDSAGRHLLNTYHLKLEDPETL